jgi:hypothetical protein
VFSRKEVFVWWNILRWPNGTEGCSIETQKSRRRTSDTDEMCVIVEGLIREDRGAKTLVKCTAKAAVQYFTCLGMERCRDGIFKLVERWHKCLNANGGYMEE